MEREFVLLKRALMNDYINEVDKLLRAHSEQKQQLKDAYRLMNIQETTYQAQRDRLLDAILDADPHLIQGLVHAYKIMNGTENV